MRKAPCYMGGLPAFVFVNSNVLDIENINYLFLDYDYDTKIATYWTDLGISGRDRCFGVNIKNVRHAHVRGGTLTAEKDVNNLIYVDSLTKGSDSVVVLKSDMIYAHVKGAELLQASGNIEILEIGEIRELFDITCDSSVGLLSLFDDFHTREVIIAGKVEKVMGDVDAVRRLIRAGEAYQGHPSKK